MNAYDAHKQRAARRRALAELASASGTSIHIRCSICERDVPATRWDNHITQDQYHLRQKRFADISAQVQAAAQNRNSITVSGEGAVINLGIIEAAGVQGLSPEQNAQITISNESREGLITLARIGFASSMQSDAQGTSFSATLRGASRFISYGQPRTVTITLHPSPVGRFEDTLELQFHDLHRRERFVIIRSISAVVGFAADYDFLRPHAPYVKPPWKPREPEPSAIPTSRPPTWSKTKWVKKLGEYPIPPDLAEALNNPVHQARVKGFMPGELSVWNYSEFWQVLLHIEEDARRCALSRYNLYNTEMKAVYPKYRLSVPGLSEGKPSVIVGDKILVKKSNDDSDSWYMGIVHAIGFKELDLYVNEKFSLHRSGNKADVRFQLNRLPLRRAHQAVTHPENPERILFPEGRHTDGLRRCSEAQLANLDLMNATLADNLEQLETVAAIANMPPGSVPFVVFGPPGTGKTVTIIEAIHQILKRNPGARVLACAPSNRSTDLLAQRLSALSPAQLLRLNSLSRKYSDLPEDLEDYSYFNANQVFAIPDQPTLKSFRVIVATCVSAGIPYGLGVQAGWFSHIFVDEAGQLTEPDIMIPIKPMLDAQTNVILAGDVKQLGPVVRSSVAREAGLKTSYMQRLMSLPIYDLSTHRGLTVTKLIKHWRSHPAIMSFANDRFYSGELQACGDEAITHSMLRSDLLETPPFPIVFHSIAGADEREEGSPSYFNVAEASMVTKYCEELVTDRKVRIRGDEIGVISPYNGQCGRIRKLFGRSDRSLEGIKVGSVEEFQGQERRVIIISTVRSRRHNVVHDLRHDLGFVGDPRRFNVAITRARAMLIVVGDPRVLSLDTTWRSFLTYVRSKGGWRGPGRDMNLDTFPSEDPAAYAIAANEQAARDVQEMLQRIKTLIVERNVADGWEIPFPDELKEDDDDEAFMDRPGEEAD
ncbi:RNA helicase [Wolfiporia cocos MD-104 SS10]|uniref:RNA helicase n=1 Tax=Wolfiporia cocos (strain MD-104) TaxID=742152 RepID=A0A2H3JIE0_WOLCO|nr:RNA helicase [Wolfiporia cocos MD-104 SS10]